MPFTVNVTQNLFLFNCRGWVVRPAVRALRVVGRGSCIASGSSAGLTKGERGARSSQREAQVGDYMNECRAQAGSDGKEK